MIGKTFGIQAYQKAVGVQSGVEKTVAKSLAGKKADKGDFLETLTSSIKQVNEMEEQKSGLIEAFASGKSENVHELMISLQKAGVAMSMTNAVRSKVLSAYQELMRIAF